MDGPLAIMSVEASFTRPRSSSKGSNRKCSPKKGGSGRRNWGKPGDEMISLHLDAKDPNFDADTNMSDIVLREGGMCLSLEEIEEILTPRIKECFVNGMTKEFAADCSKLNTGRNTHHVPQLVLHRAIENNNAEREVASRCLVDLLAAKCCKAAHIVVAINNLLTELDDLQLDTPDAGEVIAKIIARAVADDCIPPAFVLRHPALADTTTPPSIAAAVKRAHTLITMKHAMTRIDDIWGYANASCKPVKYIIKKMLLILREYLSAMDLSEVQRCLHDLAVPHFHHEFVYEAALMALDHGKTDNSKTTVIVHLLQRLSDATVITDNQMEQGFKRLYASIDDISLDIPHVFSHLEVLCKEARKAGIISTALLRSMPGRQGRKRYISECARTPSTDDDDEQATAEAPF